MKKLDIASVIGIVVLVILALTVGTIIVTNAGLLNGGKSDLTYVSFVSEHRNGTRDIMIIGYKDNIVHDYTWKTEYPKDVWTKEELDEVKGYYKGYGDENKGIKCYKMKIKETGKELIISEIYTGLDKEENRESILEIANLENTGPILYSEIESSLLSQGFIKE